MELIKQNPYNVIGILAGAKQRQVERQKAKIKAYQRVGKSIEFETDLHIQEKPIRTSEAIDDALSKIEINHNKLFYSLFWFVNNSHLDDMAIDYLRSGDLKKAEEIWSKIAQDREVSVKNFSAVNNLGTLKLVSALSEFTLKTQSFKEGVRLKIDLINSDYFTEFCHLVADETYSVSQEKEIRIFVDALLKELEDSKKPGTDKAPHLIIGIYPAVKAYLTDKLTSTPIQNIERRTQQTQKERIANPKKGLRLGLVLHQNTTSDLSALSELLGKSDLKYRLMADKVAKEILQCGVDYFLEFREKEDQHSGEDLGKDVMRLFKTSKSTAVGTNTFDRINENIEGLQEWIDHADERRKQNLIGSELLFITAKLERFQSLRDSTENALELVVSCEPKLLRMKKFLGHRDELYLKISSAVVNNAQGMLVTVINQTQEMVPLGVITIDTLSSKISAALRVSERLGKMDMVPELLRSYKKNHQTLLSISNRINAARSRVSSNFGSSQTNRVRSNESSNSGGGGCYIATMAYGSYDHPQVLVLRRFRDEVLNSSAPGRAFIRCYYWLSPKLVKHLKGYQKVNSLIRKVLNQFIKHIER
ncbi:CFI-box-CTERM domain-containing protein [Phaeodactylibacter xiamenensis]|uniref:CFI-box-CTERM domain-containing protein n=1 Tax=Phaeodactylibacter xiamenensis TaxID=1524460 RepID=UPI003CCC2FFA